MFICCFDKNFLALLSCLPPESGIFMENVHPLQLHVSSPQTFMTQIMHEILLSLEMWGVEWAPGVFHVHVKRIGVLIPKSSLDVDMT